MKQRTHHLASFNSALSFSRQLTQLSPVHVGIIYSFKFVITLLILRAWLMLYTWKVLELGSAVVPQMSHSSTNILLHLSSDALLADCSRPLWLHHPDPPSLVHRPVIPKARGEDGKVPGSSKTLPRPGESERMRPMLQREVEIYGYHMRSYGYHIKRHVQRPVVEGSHRSLLKFPLSQGLH